MTANQLAAYLAVEADWIYAHADELGCWRLGSGPKARLRFDLDEVRRRLTTCTAGRESQAPEPAPLSRRRRPARASAGSETELLPIRGRR